METMKRIKLFEEYFNEAKSEKSNYRIQNQDGTFLNAGTGKSSWFTLDTARKLVDRSKGQRIIESDGVRILWEVF
jgi:hypothetical protein